MRRHTPFILLALLSAILLCACQGNANVGSSIPEDAGDATSQPADADSGPLDDVHNDDADSPDGGGVDAPDISVEPDTPPAPCEGVSCAARAHCDNGQCVCDEGYAGDPDRQCTEVYDDPCQSIQCAVGSMCVRGSCICDPGFSPDGAFGCQADPVSDPATRSRQEVCARWNGYARQASSTWQIEPADTCDWGVLNPQVQRDALRRLNLFRWLVGLGPVSTQPEHIENTQACATTLAAEDAGLTHQIPSSYACYTQQAASGAGSSNIAMGVADPAATVDLYVVDRGVASLGHRRWCLNPSMGATGFGHRGRYGCMYSFDRSQSSSVEHILYPAEGFYPTSGSIGVWSAGSTSFSFGADPEVSVTRISDGFEMLVSDISTLPQGYGPNTISWKVPSAAVEVEYEVTISNGTDELSYRTTLVDCS